MAALVKFARCRAVKSLTTPLGALTSVRSHWNKDFKPGPYPKTQADYERAAKKYNLPLEEYKPYPDDGMGYGDYPKLSDKGVESRDPNYPYDFPELKRNFNEPLNANVDLIGEDRYGTEKPLRYSMQYQWACFLGVMTFCFVTYYWLEDKKMFRPVLPKQRPGDGKVHYTFEQN